VPDDYKTGYKTVKVLYKNLIDDKIFLSKTISLIRFFARFA